MPNKRRVRKGKTSSNELKSDTCSTDSDELDQFDKKNMDQIITRLSRQYMALDTSYDGDDEKGSPQCDTNSPYDFIDDDDSRVPLRMIVSPVRNKTRQAKTAKEQKKLATVNSLFSGKNDGKDKKKSPGSIAPGHEKLGVVCKAKDKACNNNLVKPTILSSKKGFVKSKINTSPKSESVSETEKALDRISLSGCGNRANHTRSLRKRKSISCADTASESNSKLSGDSQPRKTSRLIRDGDTMNMTVSRPTSDIHDSGISLSQCMDYDSTMSPLVVLRRLDPVAVTHTSTPAAIASLKISGNEKIMLNDSFFGFGSLQPVSVPLLSPVLRVRSPTSDYQSSTSLPSLFNESTDVLITKSPVNEELPMDTDIKRSNPFNSGIKTVKAPAKRRQKRSGKHGYEVTRHDVLLDKMNAEFEELENFELSIE